MDLLAAAAFALALTLAAASAPFPALLSFPFDPPEVDPFGMNGLGSRVTGEEGLKSWGACQVLSLGVWFDLADLSC